MVSKRVQKGMAGVASAPRDYIVIGGGYAGLNAMAGIQRGAPEKTVLCVSVSTPGGSWTQYYDHARLHAPHPHFGVSGIPWKFDDPHVLAPRKDVEEHFNDYVDQMPERFEFVSDVEFLSNKQNTDGTQTVTIKDRTTGKQLELQAKYVIDARGFDYHGHTRREVDPNFEDSDIPETQVEDVTKCLTATAACDRLYVVIGGGKTGVDTVMHIAKHKRSGDDILLVTGSSKQFLNRDNVVPRKETMSDEKFAPYTLAEVFLELACKWDGHNGGDILKLGQEKEYWHALEDFPATSSLLGALGVDERKIVEDNCTIIHNDYFVSCKVLTEPVVTTTTVTCGGSTTTTTTTTTRKTTRINFKHAASQETEKEVVLVNCRSSTTPDNAFLEQAHPLTKSGILRFGSVGGFTGPSNYLMAVIHTKHPEAIAKMNLYGHKCYVDRPKSKMTANFLVSFFTSTLANTLSIVGVLGMEEMEHFTGDVGKWYPPAQQLAVMEKVMAAAPDIIKTAETHCRRLVPGDEQPKDVLFD
eukprot:m.22655 g.22655  ORF g.22655 m.22655 type:complete len:526 (-) comp12770_c0_seq1:121-1698(-)